MGTEAKFAKFWQKHTAKFDPQPTLNPRIDCHQIWNTWLRRGYLLPTAITKHVHTVARARRFMALYSNNHFYHQYIHSFIHINVKKLPF